MDGRGLWAMVGLWVAASSSAQPTDRAEPAGPSEESLTWRAWDPGPPPEPSWRLSFEPSAWYAAAAGSVKLPGSPEALGRTDLAEFNLDSPRLSPAGAIELRSGPWRFGISGSSTSVEQGTAAPGPGRVGALTFGTGDRLDSELKLESAEVTARYRLFESRRGRTADGAWRIAFGVDALAGVRARHFALDVSGPSGAAGADEWFFEPLAGGAVEMDIWERFSIDLRMEAGAGGGYGDKASVSGSLAVGFEFRPLPNIGLRIGYQAVTMGLAHGDGDERFEFAGSHEGLMWGVALRF